MSKPLLSVATLGMPRIGPRRELKTALEAYWSGLSDEAFLQTATAKLRADQWERQRALGVTVIPSNDFSLYDHVLDTSVMVGAIPAIYGWEGGKVSLDTYFAMARGSHGEAEVCESTNAHDEGHAGLPAQELTKWFDTNYHYMVPEFSNSQVFRLSSVKPLYEFLEAKAQGYLTRPVLLGPVTYLWLGKSKGLDPLSLLERILPVYADILQQLAANGAEWVQIDEPCLVLDLDERTRNALRQTYDHFARAVPKLKIMLTTYFGGLGNNLETALSLPVAGLHIDLVRAPEQLDEVHKKARQNLVLSLGVIDGRNVWRTNLPTVIDRIHAVVAARGPEHIQIAPSCSLLHVPQDLSLEKAFDPDVKSWLAFAIQKIEELCTIGNALDGRHDAIKDVLAASAAAAAARATSPKIHNEAVARRTASFIASATRRKSAYTVRAREQRQRLKLPDFPTTTIGSFPQTPAVRKARAAYAKGAINDGEYNDFLKEETARAISWQEEIGLDVLVHGEFERNDMVQYFGEQLAGFAFTNHGWVQSYGSRCVRPPILFGDVSRPKPMTVGWWKYAQSLTPRPIKGMLTGPVTILNWSFVRDDVPRNEVCRQIAFAIRDEVLDLEKAGAAMIQIDEAALREGLPLRHADWKAYLDWAVDCFRLCTAGVQDKTQIHTHMCYADFNNIIDAISGMDADVISIETSRSRMVLLEAFRTYRYSAEIGPGVYDIHSPRIPNVEEMTTLMNLARERFADSQLWINPDCGLKTRKWDEVRPALVNMVAAAQELRKRNVQSSSS